MEYCEKGTLSSYIIKNQGKITFEQKKKILLQIAKGMRFLHSNNIVHRDLKCMYAAMCITL